MIGIDAVSIARLNTEASKREVIRCAEQVEALLIAADCFGVGEEKMQKVLLFRAQAITRRAFRYADLAYRLKAA